MNVNAKEAPKLEPIKDSSKIEEINKNSLEQIIQKGKEDLKTIVEKIKQNPTIVEQIPENKDKTNKFTEELNLVNSVDPNSPLGRATGIESVKSDIDTTRAATLDPVAQASIDAQNIAEAPDTTNGTAITNTEAVEQNNQ